MSCENDLKAIEDEILALVRTYDPATENEYEQRASRSIDAWKERGYDIYNADVRQRKNRTGEIVGVTMIVSVYDRREGRVHSLELEL